MTPEEKLKFVSEKLVNDAHVVVCHRGTESDDPNTVIDECFLCDAKIVLFKAAQEKKKDDWVLMCRPCWGRLATSLVAKGKPVEWGGRVRNNKVMDERGTMDTTNNVATPDYITELLAEILRFDENLFAPRAEVRENEKVLGPAPTWVRKAYALSVMCQREVEELGVAQKYDGHDNEKCRRMHQMDMKRDILDELTWAIARIAYDRIACGQEDSTPGYGIGMRMGWVLVATPPKPHEMIRKILTFGGDE